MGCKAGEGTKVFGLDYWRFLVIGVSRVMSRMTMMNLMSMMSISCSCSEVKKGRNQKWETNAREKDAWLRTSEFWIQLQWPSTYS